MGQLGSIKNNLYLIVLFFLISCSEEKKTNSIDDQGIISESLKKVPIFNPDTAYSFIQKQVDFGPRVPNSLAHKNCHNFLTTTLRRFGADVITQEASIKRYDGLSMQMKNIIAVFNQDADKRILLCAHWDSRFIADNDVDNIDQPILGANDGGSGVGVLLEIARHFQMNPLSIGIDIIFFDVEDQGAPNGTANQTPHSWCLGSQYWSNKPHIENYFANYGILLDMVGGENATFTKEGVSRQFASRIVDKVWNTARDIGFGEYFTLEETPPIIDDHLYINNLIHIPTINIVEYDETTHNRFNAHHHRHSDDMAIIDHSTLKAVGQTVLEVLYQE
tara:strand:+ start:1055 stop:2053 length:999 start_codon:yes stop_codon:yes gene_type:complete